MVRSISYAVYQMDLFCREDPFPETAGTVCLFSFPLFKMAKKQTPEAETQGPSPVSEPPDAQVVPQIAQLSSSGYRFCLLQPTIGWMMYLKIRRQTFSGTIWGHIGDFSRVRRTPFGKHA